MEKDLASNVNSTNTEKPDSGNPKLLYRTFFAHLFFAIYVSSTYSFLKLMFACITKTEKNLVVSENIPIKCISRRDRAKYPPMPGLPSAAAASSSVVWWTSFETFFYTYIFTYSIQRSFVCYAFVDAYYIKCYHHPANCFFSLTIS